jgi:glycosyltransferase involved in cell wall biosynthesis
VDAWTRLWRRLPAPSTVAGVPTRYRPATAAHWLFISQTLVRRTAKYKVRVGPFDVVHPGVDATLFAARPAHDWRGDLLYAGRIDARKGIATAIRALRSLPDARLSVDGDGDRDHARELQELASSLAVSDRVAFTLSPRAALGDRYGAADVVLHPVQWEEPWGLVPLEAMACGTAVVATGMGGSGEYLRDGENALLFAPGDHAALAHALARLRDDAALRARLREAGLRTAALHPAGAFFEAVEGALEAALAAPTA